ncbi:MAG: DegT/DnrJ/EryC1/StrS family aminotransferase [Deltaproteobacteria bacterium]|nr:DegT/DnrJ/EryC1/StrS family aminotransferase [Deltaproteobacteria bacterium]
MKAPGVVEELECKSLRRAILDAITEVVDSGRYILGPEVEAFERCVAEYVGSGFAVGVSSGTDALLVSFMALDLQPGDRVITTPFSFFATAGAIARLGAVPVFADIDPLSFNMSPAALEEFAGDPKVKAVVPVHLYGQCADMDAILELANQQRWAVVEDAAQALGAEYPSVNGIRKAGSMGTFGAFSFFPSKNLGGMGDAGMVVTDDERLNRRLRLLRNHGAEPKYYHEFIGGNFRLDPIQAAVLSVKLPHLDRWHRARRTNAERYHTLFSDSKLPAEGRLVPPPPVSVRAGEEGLLDHIYNQYVVRAPGDFRDPLRSFLSEAGIGTEVYYPVPFHLQKCFRHLGYEAGRFPETEKAAREVLALPIYPELTMEMQEYVVDCIVSFFGKT